MPTPTKCTGNGIHRRDILFNNPGETGDTDDIGEADTTGDAAVTKLEVVTAFNMLVREASELTMQKPHLVHVLLPLSLLNSI